MKSVLRSVCECVLIVALFCILQNMHCRAIWRQAGAFYTPRLPEMGLIRPPVDAYRGSPIAVADNPVSVTQTHKHTHLQTHMHTPFIHSA